ncbi:hypothetical protein ILYODFUR_035716 [Ilyodon furcidens]|uniref:Uncharacterized protein n=1 Tax=Ilyodon furcidens TaxID=33524 RepID=A0ABV0U2B1_9TELE
MTGVSVSLSNPCIFIYAFIAIFISVSIFLSSSGCFSPSLCICLLQMYCHTCLPRSVMSSQGEYFPCDSQAGSKPLTWSCVDFRCLYGVRPETSFNSWIQSRRVMPDVLITLGTFKEMQIF